MGRKAKEDGPERGGDKEMQTERETERETERHTHKKRHMHAHSPRGVAGILAHTEKVIRTLEKQRDDGNPTQPAETPGTRGRR